MTLKEMLERASTMLPRPNEFGLPGKTYKFGDKVVIGNVVYDAKCLKEQKYQIEQFRRNHTRVHTLVPLEVSYNRCIIGKMKVKEKCKIGKGGVLICTKESSWGKNTDNQIYTIQSHRKVNSSSDNTMEKPTSVSDVLKHKQQGKGQSNMPANKFSVMEIVKDKKFLLGAGLAALAVIVLNK